MILKSFIGLGFFAIGYYGFKYIKELELRWSGLIISILGYD
ncbi:hypothetical protein [Terrisporobacter vanillatitrophus]